MTFSRRDLGRLLPALAATAAAAEDPKVLPSRAWKYEDLPVKKNGVNESRDVFKGVTHSNFPIDLHITKLAAGSAPHPPHKHLREEMVMLEMGNLDVTIEGKTTRLTPGSVAYVHSNEMHGWTNPGPGPAQYFVLALGPNA
jgi:quercetin dioxygenase-like cupin family protein